MRDVVDAHARVGASSGTSTTEVLRLIDGQTNNALGVSRAFWADASFVRGSVYDNNGLAGFGYDLGAFVAGGDLLRDDRRAFGIYGGYGTSDMDEHAAIDQSFSGDAFHLGGYGRFTEPSGWSFTGSAGLMWGSQTTDKTTPSVGGALVGQPRQSLTHSAISFRPLRQNPMNMVAEPSHLFWG